MTMTALSGRSVAIAPVYGSTLETHGIATNVPVTPDIAHLVSIIMNTPRDQLNSFLALTNSPV
jgi:hypothetical protein